MGGQFGGGLLNRGAAKAQGQMGDQQIQPAIADFLPQLLEHLGGIQKAVHQYQGWLGLRNLAAVFIYLKRAPAVPGGGAGGDHLPGRAVQSLIGPSAPLNGTRSGCIDRCTTGGVEPEAQTKP